MLVCMLLLYAGDSASLHSITDNLVAETSKQIILVQYSSLFEKELLVGCFSQSVDESRRIQKSILQSKVPYTYNVVADPAPCVGSPAPTAI